MLLVPKYIQVTHFYHLRNDSGFNKNYANCEVDYVKLSKFQI